MRLQCELASGMKAVRRMRFIARIALALLGVTLVVKAPPAAAQGQVNPYRVQQRYNDAKKGKSIDEWTKKLNDTDPGVRLEAVRSLGDSGQPEAIEYLIQATGKSRVR
jgi:hypothetical protein